MSSRLKFLIGLLAFSAAMRLLPYFVTVPDIKTNPFAILYPWNFMPVTATCLYAGAYFTNRRLAYGLPLLGVFISDALFWIVTGNFAWAFPADRWSAYVSYAIIIMMGTGLSQQRWPARAGRALLRGIAGEAVFFLVTNFAYFLFQNDLPHTVAGLVACYTLAIPFVSKAFASTAFYSILLFSPLAIRAAGGIPTNDVPPNGSPVPVGELQASK